MDKPTGTKAVALSQADNRCNNVKLTHGGKTCTIAEWSRLTGKSNATLYKRVRSGWDAKRTLTEPVHVEKRNVASERVRPFRGVTA